MILPTHNPSKQSRIALSFMHIAHAHTEKKREIEREMDDIAHNGPKILCDSKKASTSMGGTSGIQRIECE